MNIETTIFKYSYLLNNHAVNNCKVMHYLFKSSRLFATIFSIDFRSLFIYSRTFSYTFYLFTCIIYMHYFVFILIQ